MSKFGIAFTADGGLTTDIIGWRQKNGADEVWDLYSEALEANDLGGWTGYVRQYPSGERVPADQLEKEDNEV